MEQPSQSILTNLENKIFQDDEFLVFLDNLLEKNFITEEVYFELKRSLEEKEVKNILKVWVQAEVLYYLEYPLALGIGAFVGSHIGEINYHSLSTGALVYASIIIPTIMLSRLTILSILTHFTPVPERKAFVTTGVIPLPSQIFLAVWLKNYGEFLKYFLQYIRTKSLREKIQTENNEAKKQKFIEKENQILSGKDRFSEVMSFVKGSIDRLKIPFKN